MYEDTTINSMQIKFIRLYMYMCVCVLSVG